MKDSELIHSDPPLDWHALPDGSALLPPPSDEPELTTLPLTRAIFRLAGPAVASMLFVMVFNIIDIWWVGKLGADALAGVSAASFILWALESMATLVGTGVTAMVARLYGARRREQAGRVMGTGIVFAAALASGLGAAGWFLQRKTFAAMGLAGGILPPALDYMTLILYGLPFIFIFFAVDAAFRGLGDTRTPLMIIASTLTLNILLDPVFIFGLGPVPALGAGGAALATVLTHTLGAVWGTLLLMRRTPLRWGADPGLAWRITRIGAPIAFSGTMFSISYMLLTRVITRFGPEPLAALGLGHRIEGLAYFTAVGFSVAAAALVGQNLGAKKARRAERAAWLTFGYTSALLAVVCLCFYLGAESIIAFFIRDERVIGEGAHYLRIIALFEVFLGAEVVFEGAFSGAGNSLPPMLISVPLTWARIPLALLLAGPFDLGSAGIWWAIATTTGIKGVLMALWFARGRWKATRI